EFRLGENRVQEAEEKAASLGPDVEWHLVGHLQSNKAARAAALFHWIHGLDSQRLARRLSRAAMASGRRLKALVQVNLAAEPGKSGVAPLQLPELLAGVRNLEGVEVRGLMVIPPAGQEYARASFRRLGELAHDAMERGLLPQPLELSMGMSADFEIAIEEGATIVRVGSALFGRRSP
ncbi:MAG: YggS family pyridoxal phosphate-dependent enzyme, partial [Acidobacteriota bacterium]